MGIVNKSINERPRSKRLITNRSVMDLSNVIFNFTKNAELNVTVTTCRVTFARTLSPTIISTATRRLACPGYFSIYYNRFISSNTR